MVPLNKYKLCRLCLCKGACLKDILEESSNLEFDVLRTIQDLINMRVVQELGFPWLVCSACLDKLRDFRLFKTQCLECKLAFENRYQLAMNITEAEPDCIKKSTEKMLPAMEECEDHKTPKSCFGNQGEYLSNDSHHLGHDHEISSDDVVNHDESGTLVNTEYIKEEAEITLSENLHVCDNEEIKSEKIDSTNDGNMMKTMGENDLMSCVCWSGMDRSLMRENKGAFPDKYEDTILGRPVIHPKINVRCKVCLQTLCHCVNQKSPTSYQRAEFMCETCNLRFSRSTYLEAHIKTHSHVGDKLQQTICRRTFSEEPTLMFHSRFHLGDRNLEQDFNGKLLSCTRSLRKHSILHEEFERHEHKKFSLKSFDRVPDLAVRMEKHLEERPQFTCELCPKHFSDGTSLKKHMYMHEVATKLFSHSQVDVMLAKVAEEPSAFPTGDTPTVKNAEEHQENVSMNAKGPSSPSDPTTNFTKHPSVGSNRTYLDSHRTSKAFSRRQYECQPCGKFFTSLRKLDLHLRFHTSSKVYDCGVCNKRHQGERCPLEHTKAHERGQKPVECSICRKRFSMPGRLLIHLRMHTGERPYSCRQCPKAYAYAMSLKIHERTHTGERPFSCLVCERRFALSCNLKQHMKIHGYAMAGSAGCLPRD